MAQYMINNGSGFSFALTGSKEEVLEAKKLLASSGLEELILGEKSKEFKVGDKVKCVSKSICGNKPSPYNREFYDENGYLFISDIENGDSLPFSEGKGKKVYVLNRRLIDNSGDYFLECDLVPYD